MSAKYTMTSAQMLATPEGNQTAIVRFKPCSGTHWTIASSEVVVLPSGMLQTPLVIGGLLEGTCYDIGIVNACGGIEVIRQIFTPVTAGINSVTFSNQLETGTITQIYINGNPILSSPIAAGDNVVFPFGTIGAGNHLIEAELGGVSNGKVNVAQIMAGAHVLGAYKNYTGVRFTLFESTLFHNADTIQIREAKEHLKVANYTPISGAISGTCSLPSYKVERSSLATADATATGQATRASIKWTPDNGGELNVTLDFVPTDTEATGSSSTIGTTACSEVNGVVTGVVVV